MIHFPGVEDDVTPLVLGTNPFGWTADRAQSFAVLDAFVGGGGRLIDTADGYSYWVEGNRGGESEQILGEWVRSRGSRDRVHLATKVSRHPEFTGLSAANVAAAARASLQRLGVDSIDLYYAHYDDPEVDLAETVAAFDRLVDEGLVAAVGLSNYSADRVEAWIAAADAGDHRRPTVLQPHYNLLHREAFEREMAPVAAAAGLGVVPYFALASGLLTGKYRSEDEVKASPRAHLLVPYLSPRSFAVVDEVRAIAAEQGVPPATIAIAWLRSRPGILAPIASASSTDQLRGLLDAVAFELDEADAARLSSVSSTVEAD
jgi:aryl-alcohol dehydrogenase (NADP+)